MRLLRYTAAAVLAAGIPAVGAAMDQCNTMSATQAFDFETRCVSSVLPPQSGNRYDIHSLTDGNPSTAWCEGRQGHGIGEAIAFDWGNAAPLRAIHIRNGYAKPGGTWAKNSRVRELRLTLHTADGPRRMTATLADTDAVQRIAIPWSRATPLGLHLEILSVYPGNRYTDTCISDLWTDFGF